MTPPIWGPWSDYSACIEACQRSRFRFRTRNCLQGSCVGDYYEEADCNDQIFANTDEGSFQIVFKFLSREITMIELFCHRTGLAIS